MLKLKHDLLEEVVDVGPNSFLKNKFIFSIFIFVEIYILLLTCLPGIALDLLRLTIF